MPGMAHGDAVGHGDGGELARRAAAGGDALLHRLRLALERDVAGRGLVPGGRDADQRLVDLLGGQPHRVEVGAVRRALRPFGHMAARKARLVDVVAIHKPVFLPRPADDPRSARPWSRGRTQHSRRLPDLMVLSP